MKKLSLAAMGTGMALLIAGCGGSAGSAASGAAPAGLIRGGEVKICTDPEYPPMEYFDNGNTTDPTGFDSDAARALADLWKVKVTWQITAFDGLMPALEAQRCDVEWAALYMSPERTAVADAAAFLHTGPGLIVRSGGAAIKTADDLSGKTVAVQGGGSNEITLQDLSKKFQAAGKAPITIQAYPKTAETVAAVKNGKADALIETDVAIVDMVKKSAGALIAVPGVFEAKTTFGAFTRKGSPLSKPVAQAIATMADNGTLGKIATQYGLDPSRIAHGVAQ